MIRNLIAVTLISSLSYAQGPENDSTAATGASSAAQTTAIDSTTIDLSVLHYDSSAAVLSDSISPGVPDSGNAIVENTDLDSVAVLDTTDSLFTPRIKVVDTLPEKGWLIGIGTGWSLGSMLAFDVWQEGLSKEETSLPGNGPSIYLANKEAIEFKVDEEPNNYNAAIPFSVVVAPLLNETGYLAIEAGYWWINKHLQSTWRGDTIGTFYSIYDRMSVSCASLGVTYHYGIPEKYFTIGNIERAFIVIGASGSPMAMIRRKIHESSDDLDMKLLVRKTDNTYFGYGASWRLGLSTLRSLSEKADLAIGLIYEGHFLGGFEKNGQPLKFGQLNPDHKEGLKEVSFFSNRFKIYFNVLFGKRNRQPKDANQSRNTSFR